MLLRNLLLDLLFSTPTGKDSDLRSTPFFNILCANPSVARFYADRFRRPAANSSLVKDLGVRSGIFFDPDQSPKNHRALAKGKKKGPNSMSITQNILACSHIKINGTRCGSPALREEVFCYFHQRLIRGVRTPPKSRIHPIAMLEDKESIQASLMEIINALIRNHIDVNRARLILRALYIAAKHSQRVNFAPIFAEMVTEVPEFPEAPPAGPFASAVVQAEALAHINTPQEAESEAERLDSAFAAQAAPPQPKQARRGKKTARPRTPAPVTEDLNSPQSRAYQ
jgi:hypothetical protein